MTSVVVDSDVVSYVFKNHLFGSLYDPELAGRIALISFMTVAEIERWMLQYRWGKQRVQLLRTFLHRFDRSSWVPAKGLAGRLPVTS